LDWWVLRDILKTACNITDVMYKGVGGWEEVRRVRGEGGWVNDALTHR